LLSLPSSFNYRLDGSVTGLQLHPEVYDVSVKLGVGAALDIMNISGSGFSPVALQNTVLVGSTPCTVTTATAGFLLCSFTDAAVSTVSSSDRVFLGARGLLAEVRLTGCLQARCFYSPGLWMCACRRGLLSLKGSCRVRAPVVGTFVGRA
jgi:hypothetical protein